MDDLDEVRAALGYERVNLYGASYATMSAMAYLQQYPRRVRAVAIAGSVTAATKMPLQFAQGSQRSLERLLDDCAADAACNGAFPKLKEEFAAVLARFEKGPVSFTAVNPKTNQTETVSVVRGTFVERIRRMLYRLEPSSRIPLLIHQIYQGDYAALAAGVVVGPQDPATTAAMGMFLTATCSEGAGAITEEDILRETRGAFVGDYFIRRHRAACKEWVRGEVPKNFYEPIKSDVPVLMISGELDGATPPEYAAALLKHLPNGRHLLVPNEAHDDQSLCLTTITAEFIAKGSAKELNTACVQTQRRPPFVTQAANR